MKGTLFEIVAHKRAQAMEIAGIGVAPGALQGIGSVMQREPPRPFAQHLRRARAEERPALIAEIKRASPSAGPIRENFDPAALARAYELGGATCLSVLTEEKWFEGSLHDLRAARAACALPVLCKDFIVDPMQIAEARDAGADCILLIVAALSQEELRWFARIAHALGMDVLVEAHDGPELIAASWIPGAIVGINNRDLRTLEIDPKRGLALVADGMMPHALTVAESGLKTHDDLRAYLDVGIGCFLVGEALMREDDVAAATRRLLTGA